MLSAGAAGTAGGRLSVEKNKARKQGIKLGKARHAAACISVNTDPMLTLTAPTDASMIVLRPPRARCAVPVLSRLWCASATR